ncbi:nitrilase-related carbon-nitrogen hydrolase [Desulfobotulus sp.]|jgi:predicted amidohydrolase|uniref:nitrilase-related carbon-nitrogen hydrolase n=1 Tax=Desulfobotulus sp. TaxID=1940337 RepID=UPI002A3698D2|nr:nitrilase-related carbon-nitrogen hydrolase [Desulfobotulus sp.]MDY0162279.1 nitrilase-related carbon-nitrogen hydrolase [Desulfobotulus sp.]
MDELLATVFQFDVLRGRMRENRNTVMQALENCPPGLVVLPEMWSSGFDYLHLEDHARKSPEILEELSGIAAKKRLVIVGSLPELSGGRVFNTAHVLDSDGRVAGFYRKTHLFTAGGEGRGFAAGDRAQVFETAAGPLGVLICYDLRFPELARTLMDKGAKILAVSAQWPSMRKSHWRTLARARAIENQLFVVASNRCGQDGDLFYAGGSLVVSPTDQILSDPGEAPGSASARLDFSLLENYRATIPCLRERRPEVYAP